jgi:hypothetical protein
VSAARRKGSAFARDVCDYLRDRLGLPVERRVDGGTKDRGDVAGIPRWVLELKNCRQMDLAGWMAEAEKEAANDGAKFYAVVHKRRMKGVAQAYVTMPLEVYAAWHKEAW